MLSCHTQSVSCALRGNETTAGAQVMINALLQTSVNSGNILMTWILRERLMLAAHTFDDRDNIIYWRNLSPPSSPTLNPYLDTCIVVCGLILKLKDIKMYKISSPQFHILK